MIRVNNIKEIQKIVNDPQGRFLVTVNHKFFSKVTITVSERRGNKFFYKMLVRDIKECKKEVASGSKTQEEANSTLFKKYAGKEELVDAAIHKRLRTPIIIAAVLGTEIIGMVSLAWFPKILLPKLPTPVADFLESCGKLIGASLDGVDAQIAGIVIAGTALLTTTAVALIASLVAISNKRIKLIKYLENAGIKLPAPKSEAEHAG